MELGKSDTVKSNNSVNGSVEDTVNVSVTESVRSYNDKKNEAKDIPNAQSILQRKIIEYVEDSEEEYDDEEEEEEDEGNQVNGDDGSPKSTNFEFDVSNQPYEIIFHFRFKNIGHLAYTDA